MRRYGPGDRPALEDLLAAVWGSEFAGLLRRQWDWKYERNPHNPPGGHRSMVLTCDETPVGFLGLMSSRLLVDGKLVPIAWGSELAVHPDHRGQGYRVIQNIGADGQRLIAGTARTRELAGLPLGFGAFDITRMISHKHILDGRRFLATKTGSEFLGGMGGWLLNLAALPARLTRNRRPALEAVTACGPEFDALWVQAAPGYNLIPAREAAFLQWRFLACPTRDYTVLAARRAGCLAGYVVMRLESGRHLRRAYIADIFAASDDEETWRRLLSGAEEFSRGQECHILTCTLSACSPLTRRLRRHGYLFRSPRVWITGHEGCRPEFRFLRPRLEHARDLALTRADTDLDFNALEVGYDR